MKTTPNFVCYVSQRTGSLPLIKLQFILENRDDDDDVDNVLPQGDYQEQIKQVKWKNY